MSPVNLSTEKVRHSPRRAALAELSSQPSPVSKVLATVEQAKREVAAKKLVEQRAAAAAAPGNGGDGGGGAGDGKGVVATAVDAVMATASEVQEVLVRVKSAIDAAEEGGPRDGPWVHSGFLTA